MAFDPKRTRLAVGVPGDRPGTYGVRVYEWPSGKPVRTFLGHAGPVTALAFSPDGKALASGSQDTTVLLWDLTEKK